MPKPRSGGKGNDFWSKVNATVKSIVLSSHENPGPIRKQWQSLQRASAHDGMTPYERWKKKQGRN